MIMAHFMMLSDLYGRIGQMLAEHGDAPLGRVVQNKYGDKYLHPSDLIEPHYCEITQCKTEIDNVVIKTYELSIGL